MLKIWGRVNSVNVKKALWAAEELGLKYERVNAGMEHGVTKTPEYLKMNPNSLVPTIDDDGFILWESHTIVRYLCAKHAAGSLYPTDLRARRRRALDGLGVYVPARHARRVLGPDPHAGRQARRKSHRSWPRADGEAPSRPGGEPREPEVRHGCRIHDGRHSHRLRSAALD